MDPDDVAIAAMRRDKDRAFRGHSSPLTAVQRRAFDGLAYFPIDAAFRFTGRLMPPEAVGDVQMATSTGGVQTYHRVGAFQFQVHGQTATITLYSAGDGELFVPFRDATSGRESYGGGRYLDLGVPQGDELTLDFNLAYNPYCAYNAEWTCPIPPPENWLPVPITAGERAFPDTRT
jgi:hypothetical protein